MDDCVGSSSAGSGVALRPPLVNLPQLQSKSFEYIRKLPFFFIKIYAPHVRHVHAGGPKVGPSPLLTSPTSLTLSCCASSMAARDN